MIRTTRPESQWISPLPPLFLLLFTGLYMFALPYAARSRTAAPSKARRTEASTKR